MIRDLEVANTEERNIYSRGRKKQPTDTNKPRKKRKKEKRHAHWIIPSNTVPTAS